MSARLTVLLFSLILATLPAVSGNQDQPGSPASAGGDARVVPPGGQLTASDSHPPLPQLPSEPVSRTGSTEQVGARVPSGEPTRQVNREPARSSMTAQASKEERSARGVAPLSQRSEGRETAIVRVGGSDRCDPQAPGATSGNCSRVIERRSADFARPVAPVLSPEQRLLVGQERLEPATVREAVRKVGRNVVDADATETQALAAVATPAPEASVTAPEAAPSSAAIDAIVQVIRAAQDPPDPRR
jgi:hypothetical protein